MRVLLASALLLAFAGTSSAQRTISRTSDGRVHYEWYVSDDEGIEVDIEGDVEFTGDESDIKSLGPDGRFRVEERRGRSVRAYEVRSDRSGALTYRYTVNGRKQAIDNDARERIASIILRVIRETGYKAEERLARVLRTDGVDGAFREIEQIQSSGSTARYYTALVDQADLTTRQLIRVAEKVDDDVPSSGSRSSFLMATANRFMADRGSWDVYFETVSHIPSSGDRTRVLQSLLEQNLGTEALTLILDAGRTIPSSGDKSRLLIAAAPQYTVNPALESAFFDVVNTIPSSGDRTRVLQTLLEDGEYGESTVERVFRSAAGIPSSGDRARLLIQTAPLYAGSKAHRETYFNVVDSIPSSGDHARVLLALLDRDDLDKATLMEVVRSTRGISSSGERSRVLVAASSRMTDDDLVDVYLEAAETIPSSSEQGKALTALMRAQ